MKLAQMPMPVRVPRPAWAKARNVFLDDWEKIAPARPAQGWMCSFSAQSHMAPNSGLCRPVYSQPAGVAHGPQRAADGSGPRIEWGSMPTKIFPQNWE